MLTENSWFNLAGQELGDVGERLRNLCIQRPVTQRADVATIYRELQEALDACEKVARSVALVTHVRPPESCEAGTCRHQECARQRVAIKRAAARAKSEPALEDDRV